MLLLFKTHAVPFLLFSSSNNSQSRQEFIKKYEYNDLCNDILPSVGTSYVDSP